MTAVVAFALAMEQPLLSKDDADHIVDETLPVSDGTFYVRQTHLGFCPTDVILQVRPKAIVLLNEDREVADYAYSDLIMWTQTNSYVTIMLQSNLMKP